MDDYEIVELFCKRDERAIAEVEKKYGSYCAKIAYNILGNESDTEECVNDVLLKAWESIPLHKPANLPAFLGKITRNLAIDGYRKNNSKKRSGTEIELVFDELSDVVSGGNDPESIFLNNQMAEEIDIFLKGINLKKRSLFILRYFYGFGLTELAEKYGMNKHNVSATLSNIRKRLKKHLIKNGYEV